MSSPSLKYSKAWLVLYIARAATAINENALYHLHFFDNMYLLDAGTITRAFIYFSPSQLRLYSYCEQNIAGKQGVLSRYFYIYLNTCWVSHRLRDCELPQ